MASETAVSGSAARRWLQYCSRQLPHGAAILKIRWPALPSETSEPSFKNIYTGDIFKCMCSSITCHNNPQFQVFLTK
jgi:hypothetical protein